MDKLNSAPLPPGPARGGGGQPDPELVQWVSQTTSRRYRKAALDAALVMSTQGGDREEVVAAAKSAARRAQKTYYATSALVLGVVSLAIAVALGGLTILTTAFAIIWGIRGRDAPNRRRAFLGMGLAILGLVVFLVRLAVG